MQILVLLPYLGYRLYNLYKLVWLRFQIDLLLQKYQIFQESANGAPRN